MGGGVDKWCFYDYIKTREILITRKINTVYVSLSWLNIETLLSQCNVNILFF